MLMHADRFRAVAGSGSANPVASSTLSRPP